MEILRTMLWIWIRRIRMFWASQIRIRHYLYGSGSFHQQAKKVRKILISTVFLTLSLKNDVNVPSKSNKQKNVDIFFYFLLASCQPLTKKAGSGCQCYGSPDPEPYQNVTDPEHN
jgi:hypothetical protein